MISRIMSELKVEGEGWNRGMGEAGQKANFKKHLLFIQFY
jgi:hypothetical protein